MSLTVTDQDKVENLERRVTTLSRSMLSLSSSRIIKLEGTKVKALSPCCKMLPVAGVPQPLLTSVQVFTSRHQTSQGSACPHWLGCSCEGLHVSYTRQADIPFFLIFFSLARKLGVNTRVCYVGARDSAAALCWRHQDTRKSSARAQPRDPVPSKRCLFPS